MSTAHANSHPGASEETLSPLGRGPLERPSQAASDLFEDDKYSYLKDEERAERRAWRETDESFYGVGSTFR